MQCIFVKATRHYQSIPGNYIGMLHFPATVGKFVFGGISAIDIFFITTKFIDSCYKLVRVCFIIIHLCCFKPYFIYSHFFCKALDILNLMLIGLYNQKLKENKGCFTIEFLLPFYNIFGAFNYF